LSECAAATQSPIRMHACVGHPKSRASQDDEGDPKSSRVCSPPSRITLLYDAHVAQVIKHPSHPSSDSSHLPAQPQTMWNVLRSFGTKMAFFGRARVRQINPSQIRTLFLLRESLKDNWLGEILFYLAHAFCVLWIGHELEKP
jgi:hypothetical protein